MKKILYTVLLVAGAACVFASCSNGDYNANPSSNANSSVNPLAPLSADALNAFVTGGNPSFIKATINGASWSSGDSATSWVLDSTGTNIIEGFSGGKVLALYLKNVYAVNIYGLGFHNYVTYGITAGIDSAYQETGISFSYLGNSGEVEILENDTAFIRGTFYFQGVDSSGNITNVNNGYFYIKKP